MKTSTLVILIALAAWRVNAADAVAESGLAVVEQLGRINGQALACSDKEVAARAKQLMLAHAPRTSQYGAAFEQATQKGFLSQVQGPSICPQDGTLAQRIEALATELREKLPVVAQ